MENYVLDEAKTKRLLSDFIKQYLKDHDLTQKEFGIKTNLSENTVKNFIYQKVMPTMDAIYNISINLDVDMIYILDLPTATKSTNQSDDEVIEELKQSYQQLGLIIETMEKRIK